MRQRRFGGIFLLLWTVALFFPMPATAQPPAVTRVSIFNFGTVNIEASGYGTTVTNMLTASLQGEASLNLLDRKELEAFLSLNDLQQNDNLENVIQIGTRLGLNVIVVGNIQKRGTIIVIQCKAIHIEQKRVIFQTQVRTLGDAALLGEVRKLGAMIVTAIAESASKPAEEKPVTRGPVNVQKRSGNMRVSLSWEDPPGTTAAGYEVFRSSSEAGPYVKVSQTTRPEYLDQGLERNATYYYKIRSFNQRGQQSEFSAVIPAETALTPNPPVILSTESHVRSVLLTWSPSPMSSDDPLKMKGYKLYRAKVESGPYKEVANILGKDLGIGVDTTTTLDKLFKVPYLDKGLADGEEYFYRVTAYNEKNLESEFSRSMKATTLPAVVGLSAESDLIREVRLSWSPVPSSLIKGYFVYRSGREDADFTKIKKVEAAGDKKIEYTDREGLADKVKYFYRVTAFEDGEIETTPSVTVSAVTKGKPAKLEGLQAKSGLVKRVDLTWTVSPDPDVKGYNIYWSKERIGKYLMIKRVDERTITTFSDTGYGPEKLTDNTTYYYSATTFNKVDVESDLTEPVSATTKARPAKPAGLKAVDLKVKEAPLSWEPNPEKDIDAYHVYRLEGTGPGDFSRVAKVGAVSVHTDKDLKDGTVYQYRIQAEDRDGLLSDLSDVVQVRTKPRPDVPEGVHGRFSGGQAEITWQANREKDIAHYVVYEKRWYGREKITTVQETRFSEGGLGKGKKKGYFVTAVDKDGLESDPSPEILIEGR